MYIDPSILWFLVIFLFIFFIVALSGSRSSGSSHVSIDIPPEIKVTLTKPEEPKKPEIPYYNIPHKERDDVEKLGRELAELARNTLPFKE